MRAILRCQPPIENRQSKTCAEHSERIGNRCFPLAVLILGLTVACSSKSKFEASRFFPTANEAQGWTKSGETRVFPGDHLYEYIDGDADKYVHAGVKQTLTSDYRYGEKVDAVADVFIMSTAAGATTVFESQPATGSEPVQLGDAARLYKGSLTFRKGRYFARLVAYQDVPEVPQALVALGRAIAGKLE